MGTLPVRNRNPLLIAPKECCLVYWLNDKRCWIDVGVSSTIRDIRIVWVGKVSISVETRDGNRRDIG